MYQFLESISVRNRSFQHLSWHNDRVQRTQLATFGETSIMDLEEELRIPAHLDDRQYKCRVRYDQAIQQVDWIPYVPKSIRSLQVVEGGNLDYSLKYADRSSLDQLFAQRGACDDILILKDGYVTDTSYCNVAFWDGEIWWTPDKPLLKGTCRAKLLAEGRVKESPIRQADFPRFACIRLMNAVLGWKACEIPIDRILKAG